MADFVQRIAGLPGELGIQRQYLDGELHLVDNTLAGSMAAAEQFEIRNIVVGANAIDVMDGFFLEQRAPDVLGHNVTVLHNVPRTAVTGQFGNCHPHIAVALCVFFVSATLKTRQSLLPNGFVPAFWRAVFLLSVYAPAGFTALLSNFATDLASKSAAFRRVFGPAGIGTFTRTVQWVLTVFLMVGGQVGLHHAERFAAFFARKTNNLTARRNISFAESFGATTGKAAETSVVTREANKGLPAIFASFLNRHGNISVFGDRDVLALSIGNVK